MPQASNALIEATMHAMCEGLVRVNVNGVATLCNEAAARLLGGSEDDFVGKVVDACVRCFDLQSGNEISLPIVKVLGGAGAVRHQAPVEIRGLDGIKRRVRIACAPLHDRNGLILGVVLLLEDVSHLLTLQGALDRLVSRDEVTGLLNRRALQGRLDRLLERVPEHTPVGYLLYLRLEHLNEVIERCGCAVGDEVLGCIAVLLQSQMLPEDAVARLGTDTFAMLVPAVDQTCALDVAHHMVASIEQFRLVRNGQAVALSASIGVAAIEHTMPLALDSVARAEHACRAAMRSGAGEVCVYRNDGAPMVDARREDDWFGHVLHALDAGTPVLFLQRIVDSNDQSCGYEVLLRVVDAAGRYGPPAPFLAAARRLGLLARVDQYVFERFLRLWGAGLRDARGDRTSYFSLNLTATSISDTRFRAWLLDRLAQADASLMDRLRIEITESEAIDWHGEEIAFLQVLRSRGIPIYLDDFGTGYNSFALLKRLPVDGIKVDRSITADVLTDLTCSALIKATAMLARDLSIDLVAEGVETQAVLACLKACAIPKFQGYLFHRPEAADGALARNAARPRPEILP